VESILLESTVPLEALDGREVAIPSASATSVVLLRALLETRLGVRPRYRWFDQASDTDPVEKGAAAVLRIGDIALRRRVPTGRSTFDLGLEWKDWTGLPFVYALWQCGPAPESDLVRLRAALVASHAWFLARIDELAERGAVRFGLDATLLARYWRGLRYRLDDDTTAGLMRFYALAAELGQAPGIHRLQTIGRPA
jgi:chorismate dehydratase